MIIRSAMLELGSPMARRYHVYKIVRKDQQGRYWSQYEDHMKSSFVTEYLPREYVEPNIGKLFAYNDISWAEKSFNSFLNEEIWECLTSYKPIPFVAYLPNYGSLEIWSEFWKDFTNWSYEVEQGMSPPIGAVLCEDIKLWRLKQRGRND